MDIDEIRRILREELEPLRADIAAIRVDIASMHVQLDGLPLINKRTTVIGHQVRMLKAAFNDFALTNPTSGEIQALHDDVDEVQAEYAELATRVATVERLLAEKKS